MGAMGSLNAKVRSLLVSAQSQQRDPSGIILLEKELEAVSTLLADLTRAEAPNKMARHWANEVRDLLGDIEDHIDMHSLSDTNDSIPSELVTEQFRTLVEQARRRHNEYELWRWASSNPLCLLHGQCLVSKLNRESRDLIGIIDPRDRLIKLLTNDTERQQKVVSVLGPAGIGKTTLAKQVYRQIRGQFECGAFVRASRTPDTRRLLRSIITQIHHDRRPPYTWTVQDLLDNLKEHLQHRRYLILIDGLWETMSWDIINSAFPEGTHCNRILITTDIEEVALECCDYQSDGIFKMEPQSRNDSTKLFFCRAFGSKYEKSEQLKEVSQEIIMKCRGLPLATICMATILAIQPDNSDLWHYAKEFLSSVVVNNLSSENMLREIVKMSYNSLSRHLKTCLLYLSMYPEGYTFLKADLVKQWTAEGFISATTGLHPIEVAESYFEELICRGLIQPEHIDFSGQVMFYTVHSTVFEIIRCKSVEENFTTVIDCSEIITKLSARIRRLSLSFSNAKYATKPDGITLSAVRSLSFYGFVQCLPSIVEMKLLRLLILELWGDQEELDLSGINRLFQLRYVKITTDMTVRLPETMDGLRYLETLEVDARISTIPSDIVHLPSLLHLRLNGETNLPDGIAHMKLLRTLHSFDLSSNSEENVLSLGDMTNLTDLHLICSTEESDHLKRNLIHLVTILQKLGNLESIVLDPAPSCTSVNLYCSSSLPSPPTSLQRIELFPPVCIFSRLPVWMGQLQKLRILRICIRQLARDDIKRIARLQELTILSLYVRQPTAGSIVFHRGEFPVLKCFKFRCGVLCLAFQAGAMPSLQSLKLEFNAHSGEKKYDNMLAGIEHLLNLQEITGRIGAAPGADKSDRMAAELVFKDTISRHSRLTSFIVQSVDSFYDEISHFANTSVSCSSSVEQLDRPSIIDVTNEPNKAPAPMADPCRKRGPDYHQLAPDGEASGDKRHRSPTTSGDSNDGDHEHTLPAAGARSGGGRRLCVKERDREWWDLMSSPACPEEEFRRAFRMSRATFEAVCDELGAAVAKDDTKLRAAIPVRQRVAVCIWRLATGEPLRLVSKRFGLGISTCHKLVLEVCAAIKAVLLPKAVRWPDAPADEAARFEATSGIPGVVGAMYTTHIPIIAPKANVAAYYNRRHTERNQKTSYSITVQGVVDASGAFTDVCIGWPGSMSDADVLDRSALLAQRGAAGLLQGQWVVGGAGYPLMDWLLVPYTHQNMTWAQQVFNERLDGVRAVAGDAFQRLKSRWGCLQKRAEVKLQDLPVVLGACCVLHNICERAGEAVDPDNTFQLFDDDMVADNPVRSNAAVAARDSIAHDLLHSKNRAAGGFAMK